MSNHSSFIEVVYSDFALLKEGAKQLYHSYQANTIEIIELFKEVSFPRIENLARLTNLPDKLLVLCSSNPETKSLHGTAILKFEDPFSLQLIAFWIEPQYRLQGHGKDMLDKIELLAKDYEVNRLSVRYRTYWQSSEVWERMLDAYSYDAPETLLWYVSMPDANVQFGKEWLQKSAFEDPFYVEDWSDTSFNQLESALGSDLWRGQVRKTLNPFQHRQLLLPHVSFLLKKEDALVGWLVCHLIGKDVVQCSSLFVHPTEAKGQGLKMVAEAFK